MRSLAVFGLGALFLGAIFGGLLSQFSAPPPERPAALILEPTEFSSLAGWQSDTFKGVLGAFLRSCGRWQSRALEKSLASFRPEFGTYGQWRPVCETARSLGTEDEQTARQFFETRFQPFGAFDDQQAEGLFTGYYEPELSGSLIRTETFSVPLYQRPSDLIQVDLGEFRSDLRGRRVAGRIEGNRLRPYASRAEIERAPGPAHEPLVWVDDPVDAFFLHIQGSGRVVLENGDVMRVGYAAQNGHAYTAIGRVLVKDGYMAVEDVTMQSIRQWLDGNPGKAAGLMNENQSYVYFRKIDVAQADLGPVGAQSVPLTPGRSLAVDLKHWPLGLPLWLETEWPEDPADGSVDSDESGRAPNPLQRLMIAQDTGGAIRGPVRGDVFLGFGAEAGDIAGRMKQPGTLTVLLPNEVVAAWAAGDKE